MIIRSIDGTGDWNFGKGANDYNSGQAAIAELIQVRLLSFLGDCPFDMGAGIAWFQFLGSKNQIALNLAVSAVILNTSDQNGNPLVTGIQQLLVNLNRSTRNITIQYRVTTTLSTVTGAFSYDLNG